jgi:uncharacterized membrane protein
MTDTSHGTSDNAPPVSYTASTRPEMTRWVGWVVFAGIMMILLGSFQAIEGLVAIFDRGYYLVGPEGLVVNVDYTAWGWVHLLLGAAAVTAGFGLIAGNMAARVVGVVVAVLSGHLEVTLCRLRCPRLGVLLD